MLFPAILLALCLGALAWFLRNDIAEYAAFKRLTSTTDRQRRYRVWLLRSFFLFSCGTLLPLALLHRLHAVIALPPEFAPLSQSLRSSLGQVHIFSRETLRFIGGLLGGMTVSLFAVAIFSRRSKKTRQIGDIDALMPRNAAETLWMALMSINAGLGEELFFRLLLPLLLILVTGRAILSCVIATLIFGLVHMYQRLPGILATTILGLALMTLYLWTETLWIAMLIHATLDLVGVVVRPALQKRMRPAG